jgi:uncharacterized protein
LTFLDSNIPMYLVGAPHPHKAEAQILVERLVASGERLVTDAEVLQEIVHRYTAIKKREAIGPALQVTLEIADEVFPIEQRDAMRAAEIVQGPAQLSARDAIHIAVIERYSVRSIISFDRDFDHWPGIQRLRAH